MLKDLRRIETNTKEQILKISEGVAAIGEDLDEKQFKATKSYLRNASQSLAAIVEMNKLSTKPGPGDDD